MPKHLFWWALSMACIVWYVCITWFVAYRGAKDIRDMLGQLRNNQRPPV